MLLQQKCTIYIHTLSIFVHISFIRQSNIFPCKMHRHNATLFTDCLLPLIIHISKQKLMSLPAAPAGNSRLLTSGFKKAWSAPGIPSPRVFTLRFTNFLAACTFFNTLSSFLLTLSSLFVLIQATLRGAAGSPETSKKGGSTTS